MCFYTWLDLRKNTGSFITEIFFKILSLPPFKDAVPDSGQDQGPVATNPLNYENF